MAPATLVFLTMAMAALIMLWKFTRRGRYFLKMAIYAVISVVFATAPIPIMLFRPRDSRNALIPATALKISSRLMGLKQNILGKEHIVKDSGCVVLINHQSVVDLIVLAELWPIMKNCAVISKKEIFYIWPFGLAAWLWGTIFIDRLNPEKAQSAINRTGDEIREYKKRILMFPEGTRSLKDHLMPFKKGAFHLAVASQCPIQPVIINKYRFLSEGAFDDGEITATILPPIQTKGLTKEDVPQLIKDVYEVMNGFYVEQLNSSQD